MERPSRFVLLVSCGLAVLWAASAEAEYTVGALSLVDSQRVGRVHYDYIYQVEITNEATDDGHDVRATVASTSPNTEIIEGDLTFGDVPAGVTAPSTDTFTIRQNRRYPFDRDALVFSFTVTDITLPVADAGEDSNALTGAPISLDGTGSHDPAGGLITFEWSIAVAPQGSAVALRYPTRPDPGLVPDVDGVYEFELVVSNGDQNSAPDGVKVTAVSGLAPPNARAGRERAASVGDLVTLDGSQSSDPNGLTLSFLWSFADVPQDSSLTDQSIQSRDAASPQFSPDTAGTYVLQLEVNNGSSSDKDTVDVLVSEPNLAPYADAGPDRLVQAGVDPGLNGSASVDPDYGPQPLSYSWELVSRPPASDQTSSDIANANTATPAFQPDTEGRYVARLKVSDGDKSDEDSALVVVDSVSPIISVTAPLDGTVIGTPTPNITIALSDNDAGIDVNSFYAEIDGNDMSSAFTVDESGASYQVVTPLSAEEHVLGASALDRAGNFAETESRFLLAFLQAIPGANVAAGKAPLKVHFTTDGEDPVGTIEVFRWDFDGDGVWDTYDTVARDYTHTYHQSGTYDATLYVLSSTGESDTASITITVGNSPPTAIAELTPSNGAAPLAVTLAGTGSDSDGQIALYEWDFEGDGVFDYASTTTGTTSRTYAQQGDYPAVFRVTDNDGLTATAVAAVTVVRVGPEGSPTASASASPVSGNAPLTVNFTATASDPNNAIVLYEWDFDGDGIYDYSSPTIGNTSHTYTTAGNNVATLRVTDASGLTGMDQVLVVVTVMPSLSIETKTVGFPKFGTIGLNASASSQYSSVYSADKAVDGNASTTWYTEYAQTPLAGQDTWFEVRFNALQKVRGFSIQWASVSYRFTRARIELFGDGGTLLHSQEGVFTGSPSQVSLPNVDQVRRIRIVGLESASYYYVAISEITVDSTPVASQEKEPIGTNIITSVGAATKVTILIKDAAGNAVRTLVDDVPRGTGFFTDYWDTRDDRGIIVHDGVYHAILYYRLAGQLIAYDLTDTTGGQRNSFPFGTGCNTRESFDSSVRPFEDHPLALKFTLCQPQEVTAFIGPLWTGLDQTRLRTITNREPLPAGTHTIYWDGLDDNGNVAQAPPGDSLITGFWRYDLPDNAISMTGARPLITQLSADPNYFSPFSEKCDAQGRSEGITLDFAASETVQTVEVRVYSVETGALLRRETHAVNSSEGTVFWDGKNNQGEYVDIGDYRVGIVVADAEGNASMLRYTLVRVDY